MRLAAYIISFIAFVALALGIVYKVQRWNNAESILLGGYLWSLLAGLFILIHKLREKKKGGMNQEDQVELKTKTNNTILDA